MGGSECERVLNDKKGLENVIMMSLCLENGTIEMQYGQSVKTVSMRIEGMIRCHELNGAHNWLTYLTILSLYIVPMEKSGLLFVTYITMLMLLLFCMDYLTKDLGVEKEEHCKVDCSNES
ncbi:hypothetical protein OIU77_022118 [Salix suchowensis]|uniref:Uncharacterized protein n=1 Tax=Salix suchowensis TaxID=1278906 RepID=A0ABQ9CC72_9ROSI|nr:hypothetical protein OIU78_000032 [Salix suchowensis]KAJ6397217.1 hypothetical protein OIU77_022118 [Salix suchowensis]